ncbi:MAG: hypothetical protein ACREIH_04300 [Nitrospiraceae bacterium]
MGTKVRPIPDGYHAVTTCLSVKGTADEDVPRLHRSRTERIVSTRPCR